MTTKEQERKALEQIRKIVAGLGENSYVGMAFEGCFEIAEDNINLDMGCSMKGRVEAAENLAKTLSEKLEAQRDEAKRVKTQLQISENRLKETEKCLNDALFSIEGHRDAARDATNEYAEARNRANEALAENEKLKIEVLRLKAKLFDLMFSEQAAV